MTLGWNQIWTAFTPHSHCCASAAWTDFILRFLINVLFPVSGYQSISPIFNWRYSGKFVSTGKCALVHTGWKEGLEILIKVKIADNV